MGEPHFREIAVDPYRVDNPHFPFHDLVKNHAVVTGPAVTHLDKGPLVENDDALAARVRQFCFLRLRDPGNGVQHEHRQ